MLIATLTALFNTTVDLEASAEEDETTYKMKSDLWSTLSTALRILDRGSLTLLLTLSQTSPGFLRFCSTSHLKTLWKKKKLLLTSVSAIDTVFSTRLENVLPFSSIWNCLLQTLTVWKSLKFVIWERVITLLLGSVCLDWKCHLGLLGAFRIKCCHN